jgi:hypothetical protein
MRGIPDDEPKNSSQPVLQMEESCAWQLARGNAKLPGNASRVEAVPQLDRHNPWRPESAKASRPPATTGVGAMLLRQPRLMVPKSLTGYSSGEAAKATNHETVRMRRSVSFVS